MTFYEKLIEVSLKTFTKTILQKKDVHLISIEYKP